MGPTAGNSVATARLWIIFRATVQGAIPVQTVTVREPVSGQTWAVTITANAIARKTTATAMVLDRSGSMSEDRGDGQSKITSLRQAANIFVDVMLEGDGVGVVRYNQDAQALQNVLALGAGGLSDLNRNATKDIINGNGLDPSGRVTLVTASSRGVASWTRPEADIKALTVLTDVWRTHRVTSRMSPHRSTRRRTLLG